MHGRVPPLDITNSRPRRERHSTNSANKSTLERRQRGVIYGSAAPVCSVRVLCGEREGGHGGVGTERGIAERGNGLDRTPRVMYGTNEGGGLGGLALRVGEGH